MPSSKERAGELAVLAANAIWAFFPILVALSYAHILPWTSLGISTLLSACLFAAMLSARARWHELLDPVLWRYAFYVAFSIGFVYYGLYYWGLTTTSPGNVSLIALFEVFTSYLFFNIWRGEAIRHAYLAGALLMTAGAVIVLLPNVHTARIGDFLVLAATFVPPVGNYYQQKARGVASSESLLFLRSLFAGLGALAVAFIAGESPDAHRIGAALPLLALNGIVLFGISKLLFVEGIHRISVTKAVALGSMTPALTLALAWAMLGQAPTLFQLSSLLFLVPGVLLLTDQMPLRSHLRTPDQRGTDTGRTGRNY